MREITEHHDGHGLNEALMVVADNTDHNAGGASHNYEVAYMSAGYPGIASTPVATIQFQHGPRNVEGSKPGVTDGVLLAILIDRLRSFNAGPFACRENAIALTHMEEALHWVKHRADARAKRGVLGQNVK